MNKKFFVTDKGIRLPVSEKKYLIPFLTPTKKGTKYFETPNNLRVTNEYYAAKLCQFHQFIDIFNSIGVNLEKKTFIDVGTGNGIIPKTLLLTNKIKSVLGTDLYSPYEHGSARIPLEDGLLKKYLKYFKNKLKKNILSYDFYKKDNTESAEKEIFQPEDIIIKKLNLRKLQEYKFKKLGAHDLKKINQKFDIIYCKGIEHIHNFKLVLKNFNYISKKGSYVYLKIRPFHSYLGPHRFATTTIPWGHVLLTRKEYKRYAYQFHKERHEKMISNYLDTLSIPRFSSDELIRLFEKIGYHLICQKTETPPYLDKIIKFKNKIKKFDYLIRKNSNATNLDLTTSVHHIVLQKK
ncbi:methyltransferase domain-containing protein [Candidatus Pelagibacter sp.]|jgi:2-polyprenyl-3-methyl-5-hydroxy-6-metoxy-1,4-benzoquinol methylase|nr:methyltransferase domain-containing protein [Candidatus Pelagibacter sp.]